MANDQLFTDYVETVLQDPNVDAVFVSIVPHSNALKSGPDRARDPDGMASLLVQLAHRYEKPLVVSVNGARYYDEFVAVMEEGGLPVYRNPRAAVQALNTFVRYHLHRPPLSGRP
jgi:acyl-CoA synthetase (NDP forming)